jgi:hypothetical protein
VFIQGFEQGLLIKATHYLVSHGITVGALYQLQGGFARAESLQFGFFLNSSERFLYFGIDTLGRNFDGDFLGDGIDGFDSNLHWCDLS